MIGSPCVPPLRPMLVALNLIIQLHATIGYVSQHFSPSCWDSHNEQGGWVGMIGIWEAPYKWC